MYYTEKKSNKYVINPDDSYNDLDGCIIEDKYNIEMSFDKFNLIPSVRELDGRIQASKEKWGIKENIDIHLFHDGRLCLCTMPEIALKLPNGFNFPDFFDYFLIPNLYYQSYFEKYGKEPWKGYSHADQGILESYFRCIGQYGSVHFQIVLLFIQNLSSNKVKNIILRNEEIKGHHLCICGSKQKFRKCHQEAFMGLKKLQSDYRLLKLVNKS